MKKVLIGIISIVFAWTANAQMDAGKILLTGGLNFSSTSPETEIKSGSTTSTSEGTKTTDLGLHLMGGYFIADNLAIGLGIGMDNSKATFKNDNIESTDSYNMISVMPFARYYIPYSDNFSFFGQLAAGFGFGTMKDEVKQGSTTTTDESTINVMNIGISPGFSYMMTERVALEMRYGFLGLSSSSIKNEGENDDYVKYSSTTFGLNLDLSSLVFGISVLF